MYNLDYSFSAGPFGTVVSMLLTGFIASSWYGWPMVFYSFSGAGLAWCFLFCYYGCDGPSHHQTITEEEKFYIENSLGHTDHKEHKSTPWSKIFTSWPVWAIFLTQSGHNWGFWTLLTEIPAYMGHVMNFNIKSNSVLSALPYFVLWVLSFVFSGVADLLINKNVFSIGVSRKVFNTIGILPIEASECHELNYFCSKISRMIIKQCIKYKEIIAALSSIRGKDPEQWKVIFYLTASIYALASLIFVIFGSGEVQPWNDDDESDKKKSKA
ncbi:hypothetical protein JTB14_013970 [Gonioctena quinquepunctata]|nr:hypothetical protein JTB14_013970 [Gonioctena quinquepunctata]